MRSHGGQASIRPFGIRVTRVGIRPDCGGAALGKCSKSPFMPRAPQAVGAQLENRVGYGRAPFYSKAASIGGAKTHRADRPIQPFERQHGRGTQQNITVVIIQR